MPIDYSLSISLAGRWFIESGIQEPTGGVARYYHTDLRRNARVSTEITGYTAAALMYLHEVTGAAEYFHAAVSAGRFLVRTAWDPAALTFPFEVSSNGDLPQKAAYFFDNGIIIRGLLGLWRAFNEPEFLEAAVRCGRSMASDFASGSEYHPILMLPSKLPSPRESRWSRAPGCYQLKAAMAWNELADATGVCAHERLYEDVLAASLASHSTFLPGDPDREKVMDRLHPYCYFLEGMLPRAGRPDCRRALAEGIARTACLLREIAPVFERSDVNAQLLRVRLFADRLGAVPLDRAAAEEEVAAILRFQGDHGGFCFGRNAAGFLPYTNPVSTAFCLQALHLWSQYLAGNFTPDPRVLI